MATMKDVARKANVSVTTVSHVLNGSRFVSDEARGRVLDAMDVLAYKRNALARSLRHKQSQTFGQEVLNKLLEVIIQSVAKTDYNHHRIFHLSSKKR